ncbi:glycosyltransferase [Salinimicrobium marinum]|uniref:glycosyltransferase n=1 Tax=Salinimicrobium marinum TaxID=680283 RepID=UPI001677580F|nr:glycosyltransferase [Salinimicrobium marinum]
MVIPVYIPHLEGYFSGSFEIFKFCIESILKTSYNSTFISIINNGSCAEVRAYLNDLLFEKKIQELVHSENIGKINAVLKGLVGHNIPLVTIADADVLFLSGWQEATYDIFATFERAGVVGLTPQFKSYENQSGNVIYSNLFSGKMKFTEVKDPDALKMYYKSLGWDESYNRDYLKKTLTISKDGIKAVVGSGHYVATYRRCVFSEMFTYDPAKLGLDSEKKLDEMPLRKNLWRLTTSDNYAYHMGNVLENWMEEEVKELAPAKDSVRYSPNFQNIRNENPLFYFVKNRFFVKLFSLIWIKHIFYKFKGLPKEMRRNY